MERIGESCVLQIDIETMSGGVEEEDFFRFSDRNFLFFFSDFIRFRFVSRNSISYYYFFFYLLLFY